MLIPLFPFFHSVKIHVVCWAHDLLQPYAMSCCHRMQQEGFLGVVNNQTQRKQTKKTIKIVKEGMTFFE